LKSYSMIGVNGNLVFRERRSIKTLREPFGIAAQTRDRSSAVVQLSLKCRPEWADRVARRCRRHFLAEHSDIGLGQDDVVLDLTTSRIPTWGEFIRRLFILRNGYGGAIADTCVQIQRPPVSGSHLVSAELPYPSRRNLQVFRVSETDATAIRKLGDPLARAVLSSIYSFNALISQEIIRDCYYDLFRFVAGLLQLARSGSLEEILREDLEKRLERFAFAADQRTMGTLCGIETPEGRFSTFRGGIQRVLYAIDSIPKFLIEKTCKQFWPGFGIVGFDRRFWHRGEIVNLPVDRAFKPSQWWGLSHESAHVLFDLRPKWLDLAKLGGVLERRGGRKASQLEIVLITEMFLDVFDFTFVFERNWQLYFRTIWSYLSSVFEKDEDVKGRFDSYVLRSFAVFFLQLHDPQRATITQLSAAYRKFEKNLKDLPELRGRVTPVQIESVRERVMDRFAYFRPALAPMLSSVAQYQSHFRSWNSKRMKATTERAVRMVLAGKVAADPGNPMALIRTLLTRTNVSFSTEIATILTLWNHYLSDYADEVAFAVPTESSRRVEA
jgi:hypothetical protein